MPLKQQGRHVTMMGRIAGMVAIAVALAVPAPAAAQYDFSAFTGPVRIAYYEECRDFFCAKAAIGMGQNGSGRYFAQLLHFEDSFDVEGFNSIGADTYVSHGVGTMDLWYADPHPLDPAEGHWPFLVNTGEDVEQRYTTRDYGTPIVGGQLHVLYTRTQDEGPGGSDSYTIDMGILMDPVRITTTPEPTTLALVGTGLAGLLAATRRRKAR